MKLKLLNFTKLFLPCLFLILSSCEKESDDKIQNIEQKNNNLSIKHISGKEIPNIIEQIDPNYLSTYKSNGLKSDSINDIFGNISVENILETIDSLQNKNYSFTLIPRKPKPNSIFNLVISTSKGNTEMAIMEYRMAPNFAQEYRNGTKSMAEFTGNILRYPFNGASKFSSKNNRNTCIQNIDEVVNCDEIIVYGGSTVSSGGGGGSTTIGSTYTYTGGDGGTVTHNYETSGGSVGWICNAFHVLHNGPTSCGDGSGTWVVKIYPNSHTSKLSGTINRSSCCDGTNIVGYIPLNTEISPLQYLQSNLVLSRSQFLFLRNNTEIANSIYLFQLTNPNQYLPENILFLKQLIDFCIANPNTTWEQIQNWFLTQVEGQDYLYNSNYWNSPNLTFQQQNLPSRAAFRDGMPKFTNGNLMTGADNIYGLVGGEVLNIRTLHPKDTENTCALKTSIALIKSGVTIPKTPDTFEGSGEFAGKYFFLNARALNTWMQKTFGTNHPKHIKLTSADGGTNGINFPKLQQLQNVSGIYSMTTLINPNTNRPYDGFWGHADYIYTNTSSQVNCVFGCYWDKKIEQIDIWILD